MRRLAAAVVVCALLSSSCAFARRHPRLTTTAMVSLTAALLVTVTVHGSCTSQPGEACSLTDDAPLIAAGAAVGGLAGWYLYGQALTPGAAEPAPPAPPAPQRPYRPFGPLEPAPAKASPPPTWIIPWNVPTSPLGRITYRRSARADSVGLMAACVGAKRAVYDELERACQANTAHVGVAAHGLSMTPCACHETPRGYGCSTRGEASCAQIPDDLAVLGTGSAATRVLAEATATLAARRACWAAGATAQPATTACECDAALGAASQTCGCIAAVDCGP